jgi:TetR/AcrR family transcriptional regulator, tetracycline repressor protein
MDARIITAAALDVLDEAGLDKLSMRLVAARLGVQVGGLYYYLPDKSALLRSMADDICGQAQADFERRPAAGSAAAAASELCACVRTALHSRRDAARVLAASPLSGSMSALALMDRLIALLEPALAPGTAYVAADTLMAYVTGFVLQEQSGAQVPFPMSPAELANRFPRVYRAIGADDEENFRAAVTAIIRGFAAA